MAVSDLNDVNQPLCDFLYLSFRQKENLLPTVLIEEAINNDPSRIAGLEVVKKMGKVGEGYARHFYDFRKGLRRKQLKKRKKLHFPLVGLTY
jgi:hypothetical protein